MAAAVGAWALGGVGAWWLFVRRPGVVLRIRSSTQTLGDVLRSGYRIDELYDRAIVRPLIAFSDRVLYRGLDLGLIDGFLVNGSARSVWLLAQNTLKWSQSGLTQAYMAFMVAGLLGILLYLVG